ncbi:hypothetical protein O3M35_007404 [Rhynocoris fuscipes]|uniref:Uncharacterized protein n=1 Tax=Rhynocoris fuscipes TaxID=488301 RepID=A0AAW1DBY2_9HEMI
MATTGILPTHQRFLHGAPVPSSVRRSFRPREKYLILLVFLTFGLVCFGAFFFLPEFKSGVAGNSVYRVYKHIQKAGPELLIPAPPLMNEFSDNSGKLGIYRHGSDNIDPHKMEDRAKLFAKIEEDLEKNPKVLERPDNNILKPVSSSTKLVETQQKQFEIVDNVIEDSGNKIVTVPPSYRDKYPVIVKGEDADEKARFRRNKVLEVSFFNLSLLTHYFYIFSKFMNFHVSTNWYLHR